MKRKFWIGASFSALLVAAMAPWSASQANGVSIRVNTPEFGFRIGGPVFGPPVYAPPVYAPPVYQPAPVYYPAPVPVYRPRYYAPPPVVYVAPPRYYGPPRYVGGYRGYGSYRHWQQRHGHGNGPQQHDRNWQASYGGR